METLKAEREFYVVFFLVVKLTKRITWTTESYETGEYSCQHLWLERKCEKQNETKQKKRETSALAYIKVQTHMCV